jgi:DNA-binding HxlR family transcriptional regulator
VDFDALRDIDKMFTRRWDVFVIACLSEQEPLRFNQLAHMVSENSRNRIADSTLNRVKGRLIRAGLLQQDIDDEAHPTYSLTSTGRAKGRFIRALTEAVHGPEDPPGSHHHETAGGADSPPNGEQSSRAA